MENILVDKFGSDVITGDRRAQKPGLIGFINTINAVELLRKHISNNSRIAVHCDVDVDGIGSGYILKAFLKSQGAINTLFLINKEKIHGIHSKHVTYFNDINNTDLLIILDSSTNEIELIKKFKCDVIVFDHHEILHNDLQGVNEHGYEYVIVNNMKENSKCFEINEWLRKNNNYTNESVQNYVVDDRMSGAMVLYEVLRTYCEVYKTDNVLENLMLYQWVGITLFTDSVSLLSERNQWYVENTVHSTDVEPCLKIILGELTQFKVNLDKSFIVYGLAPIINKAVRYGAGGEALDIVINRPKEINKLETYKNIQAEVIEKCAATNEVYSKDYIIKDITETGVSRNYCGVIAAKLCGENNKNTVVYIMNNGLAEGSFRGRKACVDYRGVFESHNPDIYAQGHKAAFGFKVRVSELNEIMSKLSSVEPEKDRFYLTAGQVPQEYRGINHIEDMNDFKRQGNLWRLAIANSKLSSIEQLGIIASSRDAVLSQQRGKLYIYNVLGLECKAFEPINTSLINIYAEHNKIIEIYVKNFTI